MRVIGEGGLSPTNRISALGALDAGLNPAVLTNPRKILRAIPFFRIALWEHLDALLDRSLRHLEIYPRQSQVVIHVYATYLREELWAQVQDCCESVARKYGLAPVQVLWDKSRVTTAKSVYNSLLQVYDRRRAAGRRQNIYSLTRCRNLPSDTIGCMIRVSGKRGMRTYSKTTVLGKLMRGTKTNAMDLYRGQVKDKRGTTGVYVSILRRLPEQLKPTLLVKNCANLPQSPSYYSTYYHL